MIYEEWTRNNKTFVQQRDYDAEDAATLIELNKSLPGYGLKCSTVTIWFE